MEEQSNDVFARAGALITRGEKRRSIADQWRDQVIKKGFIADTEAHCAEVVEAIARLRAPMRQLQETYDALFRGDSTLRCALEEWGHFCRVPEQIEKGLEEHFHELRDEHMPYPNCSAHWQALCEKFNARLSNAIPHRGCISSMEQTFERAKSRVMELVRAAERAGGVVPANMISRSPRRYIVDGDEEGGPVVRVRTSADPR